MANIYLPNILITEEYLKAYSPIPDNYDWTDLRPFIPIAESVHIMEIIGKPLYEELLEEVATNKVTDVNSTLLLKIYPLEAIAIVYEGLPFIHAHLSDKGITIGKSDNSESITKEELSNITNHLLSQMEVLKKQLKAFLDDNADCFPLYKIDEDCCVPKVEQKYLYTNKKFRKRKHY